MRSDVDAPGPEQFGRIELRVRERRLRVDGQPVALGSRAFDLLAALVAHRDRVVPKDELIELVWPGLVVEDNNLQVQISALRKVLGPQTIATVTGRGYRFAVAATSIAPRAQTVAGEALRQGALHRTHARRSHLLVVDDNRLNRLLLCRSLELMGHQVDTVVNGREALEHLRRTPIDLLLLDLDMPELDGFQLLELRASDQALLEIPVIVTSALDGDAHVARCIELGADDYLRKPPNPILLEARVNASLARKHLRDRERELLSRLLPEVTSEDGGSSALPGHHVEATVLRADLHDVEALSETPARTLELLGDWCTLMLDVVEGHGGLVTQLGGDGITAVFGATGARDAPWSAVQSARDMLELVAQFNLERGASGRAPITTSIGIASGPILIGEAGTKRRSAYVCVGTTARRAVHLQSLADQGGDAILMDGGTEAALIGRVPTHAIRARVLPGGYSVTSIHALNAR